VSDIIDQTDEREAFIIAAAVARARHAAQLAPGAPGECTMCGDWSGRLVKTVCARCRDRHNLA
jgi:hypothetical protein